MYEKLDECPLCGFSSHSNHLIVDDHSHSHESFALVKCNRCNFIYTNPRPDSASIGSYYESDNYISHTSRSNNLTNLLYKAARYFTLRWKQKLITKFAPGKSMLDYGCGTGDLLAHMYTQDWKVLGIEPNDLAREKAQQKHISVLPELSNSIKDKFDIITAWHVIEHVHDLKDTLRALRKLLNKDGKILIALPNCTSYDAEHYHTHWAGYDVPRHLYHFTPETLHALAGKVKFKVQEILPMKLDSLYVSMLSEKYLGNKLSLLRGIKTGVKSNTKARDTGNYSSLIYVLTK